MIVLRWYQIILLVLSLATVLDYMSALTRQRNTEWFEPVFAAMGAAYLLHAFGVFA